MYGAQGATLTVDYDVVEELESRGNKLKELG
jgi:hypothetical protein